MDKGSLRLYELRHYYVSHMLDLGVSAADIAIQVGHRGTQLIHSLYGHPSEDLARQRLRAAMGENVTQLKSVDREASNG
jgi:integrase